jgi:hypothetical protein
VGFKVENGLGSVRIDGPVGLIVNSQANQNAGFSDRLNTVVKLIKTTGTKIANKNIEELRVCQCGLEAIKQGLMRAVGKEGEVGALFAHGVSMIPSRMKN